MKQQFLTLSLGIAAMLLATHHAFAAPNRNCAERAVVLEKLATKYQETRQSIGLAANNAVVETFASLQTGSWTIIVTVVSGQTCIIAAGEAFENLAEDLTPAVLGDPA